MKYLQRITLIFTLLMVAAAFSLSASGCSKKEEAPKVEPKAPGPEEPAPVEKPAEVATPAAPAEPAEVEKPAAQERAFCGKACDNIIKFSGSTQITKAQCMKWCETAPKPEEFECAANATTKEDVRKCR